MPDFYDLWSNGGLGTASAALENSHLIRSSAGVLYGLDGWSSEAATCYVLVFDSAAAVANGNPPATWPKHIIQTNTSVGSFGLSPTICGEYYKNGIWIAISTTAPPNFTISTSSLTHFNVLHGPIFGGGQP